jgi:hypothetical protein
VTLDRLAVLWRLVEGPEGKIIKNFVEIWEGIG